MEQFDGTDQCRHISHWQICPVDNLPPAIGAASGDTLNVAPVEVTEYPVVQLEPLWLAERVLMARRLFNGVNMVRSDSQRNSHPLFCWRWGGGCCPVTNISGLWPPLCRHVIVDNQANDRWQCWSWGWPQSCVGAQHTALCWESGRRMLWCQSALS